MGKRKFLVEWEVFTQRRFYEVHCGVGVYEKRSKEFDSRAEATGFAEGLRANPLIRDVRTT